MTHPFQWHVVRNKSSPDYPFICFSRLRGFDDMACPNLEYATAKCKQLNDLEKWTKNYPQQEIEKYIDDVYSEDFLANLI